MAVGRPREFDLDEALDRAMGLFWKQGYEGTTIPELTRAMGINRPSLYAAFGNKESLFHKALDRYLQGPASHVLAALAAPTARGCAERLLLGTVESLADPKNPRGCMIVQAALACGEATEGIRCELATRRALATDAIRERLERAKRERDLPAETDCGSLALYLATVVHGLAVEAASGATHQALRKVAEIALRAWPD